MDKKLIGLLGAAAALTTMSGSQPVQAAPAPSASAASYRDLLDPIPNAVALMKADDARLAQDRVNDVADHPVQLAQYHHHHHHHHHHGFIRVVPPRVVVRPRYHHHHHHHHHGYIYIPGR